MYVARTLPLPSLLPPASALPAGYSAALALRHASVRYHNMDVMGRRVSLAAAATFRAGVSFASISMEDVAPAAFPHAIARADWRRRFASRAVIVRPTNRRLAGAFCADAPARHAALLLRYLPHPFHFL